MTLGGHEQARELVAIEGVGTRDVEHARQVEPGQLEESAGQVAERLEAIYIFCKRLMMEARLERDATKLTKIRSLMGELRESWSELAETGAAG